MVLMLLIIVLPLAYASSINKTAAQPDPDGYCCYLGGIIDAWAKPKTALSSVESSQRDFTLGAEELQTLITERENHLNTLMQQLSEAPENTGDGAGDFTSECIIATAAYGSNLAPQVQFLRDFRDGHIKTTVTGSAFMNVFNSWYYSFSPQVAAFEREQPWLQQTVRTVIQPLLLILQLSENGYSSFKGESGSVAAGIIASSLIGSVYLSPIALLALRKRSRMRTTILLAIALSAASIVMITAGLIIENSVILMPATAVFVLAILIASATGFARLILSVAGRPEIRLAAMRISAMRRYRKDAFSSIVAFIILLSSISVAYASAPELQVPADNLGREEIVRQLERLEEIETWLEDTRRIESFFPASEESYDITVRWVDFFGGYMANNGVSYEAFRQTAEGLGNSYQKLSSKVYNDGVADRHFVLKETLSSAILQLSYSISDMFKITFSQEPPDPYYSSILALETASENFNTYSGELAEETSEIGNKILEVQSMPG